MQTREGTTPVWLAPDIDFGGGRMRIYWFIWLGKLTGVGEDGVMRDARGWDQPEDEIVAGMDRNYDRVVGVPPEVWAVVNPELCVPEGL